MTWIIKVEDQYLEWHERGNARCSKKQKDALRFETQGHAYRVAARTFGLLTDPDDDDGCSARVVKLVPPLRVETRTRRVSDEKGGESK